jgi:hypothetical protein
MLGSWRWNVTSGGIGVVLVLLFSLGNNPFLTTITRCFYAFILFGLLAYVVRFILGMLMLPPAAPAHAADVQQEEGVGATLDLVTPDEGEELGQLLKENWSGSKTQDVSGFKPLTPKRFVTLDNPDPETVTQAIRRMSDER